MPAKSKAQKAFMGAVYTCKKTNKCPSKKIKETADQMTIKQIRDYLKGSPAKLPQKKKAALIHSDNKNPTIQVIQDLISLGNHLDNLGLKTQADELDLLISKIAKA